MKISEVHGKLDRRCVIAIRQHSGIFELLARMDQRIPAYTFTEEDRTYIQLFFPKSGKPNQILAPILSRKDLVEKRSYYSISERINNIQGMKVIGDLLEAPSLALNDAYLLKDELYIDFRFHGNRLHEINDILSEVIGKNQNFRIVKLAHSRTFRDRMQEMHSQTPLAVVRYSIPIPLDNPFMKYMAENHADAVAEIEGRSVTDEGIKILLYTSKPVEHGMAEVISQEDNVYETYVYEKSLVEGRRRGNEAKIPRIAFFLNIENGRLYDTTFVPAAEADEYVSIMMNSLMADHGTHPLLEYYSEMDEEVWEWL
ncbi:MAG: hypothetical protein M1454_00305 [Candidatus Thermoplasmatota archaeon]|nr:hypothetical protein [Candidatus Thermoplasmatota archaeon]MCL5731087.1 hypothetical protein [Candidatus Thermoplasmatota archaeon]